MKNLSLLSLQFIALMLFCLACREVFEPEVSSLDHNILVVEGYIEVGGGQTSISLGRTNPVYDSASLSPVLSAAVSIESESGSAWLLNHLGNGTYSLKDHLPEDQKYMLRISTEAGEYWSELITPIITPEIQEVNFEKNEEGVIIYASTLGNEDARYFIWDFEETWTYRSAYRAYYRYERNTNQMILLKEEEHAYKCWKSNISRRIILASSEGYQNDHIYQKELLQIADRSDKLGERYSLFVKQKAINREAFIFWEAIRKNSDDIGGIFSPLPSLVSSNLYNINNPEEPVIGYISAGKSAVKRIFINKSEVEPWRTLIPEYIRCQIFDVPAEEYPNIYWGRYYVPLIPNCGAPVCPGFLISTTECADCTVRGGFLQKPDFWID